MGFSCLRQDLGRNGRCGPGRVQCGERNRELFHHPVLERLTHLGEMNGRERWNSTPEQDQDGMQGGRKSRGRQAEEQAVASDQQGVLLHRERVRIDLRQTKVLWIFEHILPAEALFGKDEAFPSAAKEGVIEEREYLFVGGQVHPVNTPGCLEFSLGDPRCEKHAFERAEVGCDGLQRRRHDTLWPGLSRVDRRSPRGHVSGLFGQR